MNEGVTAYNRWFFDRPGAMRNATLRTERVVEGWVERGAELVLQCVLDPAERSLVANANRTLFVPSLFCLLDNTDSVTVQDYFSGTYFLVEHSSKVEVGTARLLEHPFPPHHPSSSLFYGVV